MLRRAAIAAAGVLAAAGLIPGSGPGDPPRPPAPGGTQLAGCPLFPADNPWNQDISTAPVDPRSHRYVRSIGLDGHLHAGFASHTHGMPFVVVPAMQKPVPIRFTAYGYESDPGPYPIPHGAPVEGIEDRHVIVLQRGTCRLYELFAARRSARGWKAASGATWDLRSNRLRPRGWTSADAAGLPILPGLARADEVTGGSAITHALRVTVARTQRAYVAPARHLASFHRDPDLPPMGLRLRLKASFDLRPFRGQARVILEALKRYGLIVADNGPGWSISGAADRRWSDAELRALERVPGRAFEAVRTGPLTRR